MTSVAFPTPMALAKYVNDTPVAQADIVAIWFVQGQWWLFHF